MRKAYQCPQTQKWLESIGSFEGLVSRFGIKGSFTDADCNVYDSETGGILTEQALCEVPDKVWTARYYENVKQSLDMWYTLNGCAGEDGPCR